MRRRKCGKSDLELSVLGLGCWAFGGGNYWGSQDQNEVERIVKCAVELGVNYFDTAEAYNDGHSEESLGKAIKGLSRDKLIIGTKVSPSNTHPDVFVEHCNASLKRLCTDYIDIYMIHWPIHSHSIRHFTEDEHLINNPPKTDDAVDTMLKLQQQGKIRHIGLSNFSPAGIKYVKKCSDEVIVDELPYSLLTRQIEYEALPYCAEKGIGVIGYMTLLQGILADIYKTLDEVPPWQRRTRHFDSGRNKLCRHSQRGAEEETNRSLEDIRKIAQDCDTTMPVIALKWAIANDAITSALVGSRSVAELETNVQACQEKLHPEIIMKLNAVTRRLMEKLGYSFDYYESSENDRTCWP